MVIGCGHWDDFIYMKIAGLDNHCRSFVVYGFLVNTSKKFSSAVFIFSVLSFSCRYSYVSAFGKMVVETNDLAGQRELIAEYLQNEVMKPLHDLAKNTLSERKKLMGNGVELHKELRDTMDVLERVRLITLRLLFVSHSLSLSLSLSLPMHACACLFFCFLIIVIVKNFFMFKGKTPFSIYKVVPKIVVDRSCCGMIIA